MRPSLGRALRFFAASAALSRGVPFLLNIAVARRLTPAELGVPTVHFALVRALRSQSLRRTRLTPRQVSTAVLTVREGFRRACLRHDAATALAVGWLAVPAGAVVALLVAAGARVALGAEASSPYGTAVAVVCAAGAWLRPRRAARRLSCPHAQHLRNFAPSRFTWPPRATARWRCASWPRPRRLAAGRP
jgi:hypothetical protein